MTTDHGPPTTDHGPPTTDHGRRTTSVAVRRWSVVRGRSSVVGGRWSFVVESLPPVHRLPTQVARSDVDRLGPDDAVVGVLLEDVGCPPRRPAECEDRGE